MSSRKTAGRRGTTKKRAQVRHSDIIQLKMYMSSNVSTVQSLKGLFAWLILMFLNELIFVEASAPFPLKLYSLLESHQQCVCHVQPGPNSGKLNQNIPECPIPQDFLQHHLINYESNKWNTGVQRGIQHDWPQQVCSKFQKKIHQMWPFPTTGMDS